MMKWMQENVYAAGIWCVLRLYLGWEWATAGWHKLAEGFDATGFMKGAVTKPVVDRATNELIYPVFTWFLDHIALPNAALFNIVIPIGELLVGLGLILGVLTTTAAFFGLLMNFMFMFAGTVSTNPWLVLLGGILLLAGANAGRFGVEHYAAPWLQRKRKGKQEQPTAGGTKHHAHT